MRFWLTKFNLTLPLATHNRFWIWIFLNVLFGISFSLLGGFWNVTFAGRWEFIGRISAGGSGGGGLRVVHAVHESYLSQKALGIQEFGSAWLRLEGWPTQQTLNAIHWPVGRLNLFSATILSIGLWCLNLLMRMVHSWESVSTAPLILLLGEGNLSLFNFFFDNLTPFICTHGCSLIMLRGSLAF